jgi:hypothetical protein
MPDDQPFIPRPDPERIDLAAIKTDLEFIMERLSKLPTRQELALRPPLSSPGPARSGSVPAVDPDAAASQERPYNVRERSHRKTVARSPEEP